MDHLLPVMGNIRKRRPLPLPPVMNVATPAVSAVATRHGQGFCDGKPEHMASVCL